MREYRSPVSAVQAFRDEHDRPIDYGHRWHDSPPDDAYSVVSHPQRFAPVHAAGDALIEWLSENFDAAVHTSPSVGNDLLDPPGDVVRAARVVPSRPDAAALTFVFTPFPGVRLHAGVLTDFHFPVCGCDACDDDVAEVVDELEWTVRAVVLGNYGEEFVPALSDEIVEYRLEDPEGNMRSGRCEVRDLPVDRVRHARSRMPPIGRWSAWPQEGADSTV